MIQSITSRDNPAVKRAAKLTASARHRREQGLFVAEGVRLCLDAVSSGVIVREFFYTPQAAEKYRAAVETIVTIAEKSNVVSQPVMAYLADTQTPQGVLCICSVLDKSDCVYKMNNNSRLLLLEDLQDPSNLGTILRTAEALGVGGVLMSRGCCDVYSPKVLRGSMGAVFRLPFSISEDLPRSVEEMRQMGYSVYAAVPAREAQPVTRIAFSGRSAVVIGNEGNGLTQACMQACNRPVTIPMAGRAESLNAATAASILLWEMVRGMEREAR